MKKFIILNKILIGAGILILSCCAQNKPFEPIETVKNNNAFWLTPGINQISNGNFSEKGKGWNFFFSGGNAKESYGKDKVEIRISSTGNVDYGVQYYYDGFRLYQDGEYTFSFKALASSPKGCEVRLQINGGDYHPYAGKTITLTQEITEYTISFTMTEESDITPRLAFNMGQFNDRDSELPVTVTISDVSLILENNITPKEKKAAAIRTNQIGYRPDDMKHAFVKVDKNGLKFRILNEQENEVFKGKLGKAVRDELAGEYTAQADFSQLKTPGIYTMEVEGDRSYPFAIAKNVYDDLMLAASRFFYLQRCGCEIEDPVFGHEKCHTGESRIIGTNNYTEAEGGWHDAGDYGRYTVTTAKVVMDLMQAWDVSKENYSGYNFLEEAKWGLNWLLKMQRVDGAVYHKNTNKDFPPFVMPQFETEELFISPISTPATGDFAGVMAMASLYFKETDPEFSQTALEASRKAWKYLENNKRKSFSNPSTVNTGEYGDSFDDDERYFAALALFAATEDQNYIIKAKKLVNERWKHEFGWQQMEGYGDEIVLKYSDRIDDREFVKTIKGIILDQSNKDLETARNSGYGLAVDKFVWGSNMTVLDKAHLFMLATDISGKDKYRRAARDHFDYVMGNNPMATCYITGFGTISPQQPHHRPSIAMNQPMKGMLVGGPDEQKEDAFARNLLEGKPPMLSYLDHYQSFSTNEIAINWNSSLVYCLAKLIYE